MMNAKNIIKNMIMCIILIKNYVLQPIYNDENKCINDTLSLTNP